MAVRALILGATGMLGHKLYQTFRASFETFGTVRDTLRDCGAYNLFNEKEILTSVDALNIASVENALRRIQPNVVVNCIGIVKQVEKAKNQKICIAINALFPHQLAELSDRYGFRLIHISTDCVFSGHKGNYTEEDVSDAQDLYGRTKYLGEVDSPNCLTIRTSMIGRELNDHHGLLEWFLSQRGKRTKGFTGAIFTGFTTNFFSNELRRIVLDYPQLTGLYHVSSNPITKFELLLLLKRKLNLDIQVEPYADFECDRSLNSKRYRTETGFVVPSWEAMIEQLCCDQTPYDQGKLL